MIGTRINQYQITGSVGAGGMGEVFCARDTRLNREVAVKVLAAAFAGDPERLRRFEQEAKTLAALNHPNVLTIYDAGVREGAPYLVSELLEGQTLRHVLASGAGLPVRKATEYALQMAHGLAAAHSKGIIHRDLKPENIFVTKDGRVKILDFGLAKLQAPDLESEILNLKSQADDNARTILQNTQPGRVLGTPAYMSPEQVRGEAADQRSDIFAFGCVLYETLTGTRAFRRETPVESMSAILNETPLELGTACPQVPLGLARIVERCLEKQSDNRFQSAKDLAFALESLSASGERIPSTPNRAPARWLWPASALGVLLLVALGTWLSSFRMAPGSRTKAISTQPEPTADGQKSVAVLPFVNMSAEKADEYLSDGMTEEVLNALARIKGLRVPGRSSSFAFKGKNEENIFRKVGEQLHVSTVLEGSVRKAGEKLRITIQLVNVADGFHLWSETYDRDMPDIFAIQSDIAARVADVLKLQLLGPSAARKNPTDNVEAYKLYLQGRQLWNRRTGDAITEAISYFNRAIAADPAYAVAYSGLADAYATLSDYSGVPLRETAPKTRAAALRAIELDESLGAPHAALGISKANSDWDCPAAEAELRRAIQLQPNYATSHHWLGLVFEQQGRFTEALHELERAREIDPLSPIINVIHAVLLFESGQEDLAVQSLQRQITLDPQFAFVYAMLGESYLDLGQLPKAISALEKARQIDPDGISARARLGFAYARAGRMVDAQRLLAELEDLKRQGQNVTFEIALVQHALGKDSQALGALEQALDDRAVSLPELFISPLWKDLRPHPRAQAILRQMHLVK